LDKVFPHGNWERLVSLDRYTRTSPEIFLNSAAPDPADIWADIGCGPGFFTLPLAAKVARMLAVDISREMLDICRQRAEEAGANNIEYLSVIDARLPMDDNAVDHLLLANVLHEFDDREKTISELKRVLRPGGMLYIIDWKYEEMDAGPPLAHRLAEEQAVKEVTAGGFQARPALPLYTSHYTLPFTFASQKQI